MQKFKSEKYKPGLEYATVKDSTLIFKCVYYNKNYEKKCDDELKKRFQNTYRLRDKGINKFCLMLQKMLIHAST